MKAEDVPPHGRLSGIAAAVAQLPAEIRMGAEAAEQVHRYVMAAGRTQLGAPTDHLGGLPWSLATPVVTEPGYPPNLWVMTDNAGRAIAAGTLNPPPTYPGGTR